MTNVGIGGGVTMIGGGAFYGCTNLISVTIGTNVASIGDSAFQSCSRLNSMTIPDSVIAIGYSAFADCTSLKSVILGNGIRSTGFVTFYGCTSLTKVTMPDTVTNIGRWSFAYCESLANITIGRGVINIEENAFVGCATLTGVYFRGSAPGVDSSAFSDSSSTIYYLPLAFGWSSQFGGRPTVLWNPQVKTDHHSFGVSTNQFGFTITGSSNLAIVVEASTNLVNLIWTPVGTNVLNTFIGTNGSSYFSDPQWTNYRNRFYRLRSP